jgi:CheY-like chemotaxis protein
MTDAVATDGSPPPGSSLVGVSDRSQRGVPALPTVLFADASADYRAMARDALLEGRNATDLRTVGDAQALLAYVNRAGATDGAVTPVPSLIVIDADLGNAELITALKHDPRLRRIPVIVLGHTEDSDQVATHYDAGANTYILKPVTFLALVRLMKVFTAYWLETAELPPAEGV